MNREKYISYLFVIPALIYVGIFSFYPTLDAVYLSFRNSHGQFTLDNYLALTTFGLYHSILNTIFITIGALLLQLFLGLIVASILMKEFRGKNIFSTIVILPIGFATVVSAVTFSLIFSSIGGYANSILLSLGLHPINWYANTPSSIITLILADSWKNTPLISLILLSGMVSIPPEIYQAAAVDGAGPIRRFFYITIPNLKSFIAISLIIRGISEFNIFALPLILVGYRPLFLTTLVYELYSTTATYFYSVAAASILLAFITVFIVIIIKLGGYKK